jgi:chromosome segregation ATPase
MNTSLKFVLKILIITSVFSLSTIVVSANAQSILNQVRQNIKTKQEELKKEVVTKREEAKKQIETVRQEAQKKAKAKLDEVKAKISQIKDEQKRKTAENLQEQLNHINEQWTTHFSDVLNQFDNVLAKIEIRAAKAETNGQNVSNVKTAIETARVAIKTARDAVAVQAAKIYTVKFESEDKLKDGFKTIKEQLKTDLAGLRDGAIKNARKATQDVFQVLRQIPGVDKEPTATSTPAGTNK